MDWIHGHWIGYELTAFLFADFVPLQPTTDNILCLLRAGPVIFCPYREGGDEEHLLGNFTDTVFS